MHIAKIKKVYHEFKTIGKAHSSSISFFSFMRYVRFRIKLGVNIEEYFSNGLHHKGYKHTEYYQSLHVVIHQWSNVKAHFCPNLSPIKSVILRIDYFFSKIIYHGLDPMDYFRYEFYNYRHKKRASFITEGGISKMDKCFNGKKEQEKYITLLENKAEFNTAFASFINRKWIITESVDYDAFQEFCNGMDKVIVKPIRGGAGHGIFLANVKTEIERKELFDSTRGKKCIIEELIIQDDKLNSLNPTSVNTIRVYSVAYKGIVLITGATLRMGNRNSPIDNYSTGGLAAEIDTDIGLVITPAVSQYGEKAYIHPYSGTTIIGFQIPKWSEIKEVVKKAHSMILELGYIGWDVVVCRDGQIKIIEANTCAAVDLQQHPGLQGKKGVYSKFLKKRNKPS